LQNSEGEGQIGITYGDQPATVGNRLALSDLQVQEIIATRSPGALQTLQSDVLSSAFDTDTKQDILANIDSLFSKDSDLVGFLHRVVSDRSQPDEVRVDALRKLSDHGIQYVLPFIQSENEELASEADLLQRIEAYKQQEQRKRVGEVIENQR
jgi:hypothetical protein